MRTWLELPELSINDELLALVGGNRLAAQALRRRGLDDIEAARAFLDPDFYTPAPPEALPGVTQAAARLEQAIRDGERILVWGDFDVDGQTATALLVDALRALDGRVSYHIPVRALESHGVSLPVLQRFLAAQDAPRLVLTCDTGISAHPAVAYARGQGVEVIITDHHELPCRGDGEGGKPNAEAGIDRLDFDLPEANWIVTPRFLAPGHPMAGLPGVGVAYKLAEALYQRASRAPQAEKYLDLVALGIVADVAHHTPDVRYLLQRGLKLLRRPERAGLQAIYERAELNPERLTEEQVGFSLAPRLNALGRLADANPAVELLTTEDMSRARLLALELEGLNSRRQLLTGQVLRAALAQIDQQPELLQEAALVLAHPAWPAGVIGIVASRLVELFGKPALLIASPAGEAGRGSARSVEGVDINAAIAAQADLLHGFGGHAMAAGFSIDPENIPGFRRRVAQQVEAQVAALPGEPAALQIDAWLEWGALDMELAEALERLAPFGPGNPQLTFATRDLRLSHLAAFGRQGEHLQLTLEDESENSHRVVWWGGGELDQAEKLQQGVFDLAYSLRGGSYRGQRQLQVSFLDYRPAAGAIQVRAEAPALELRDYRQQAKPLAIVQRLLAEEPPGSLQVWAEGEQHSELKAILGEAVRGRDNLSPCRSLVIWTAPPGRAELKAALERGQPVVVTLIGWAPETDELQVFLKRLAGLVKHVLSSQGGLTTLERLAAASAQGVLAVQLGLEWLAAGGHITVQKSEPQEPGWEGQNEPVRLAAGGLADPALAAALQKSIAGLLEEAQAYRKFFQRVDPATFLAIL